MLGYADIEKMVYKVYRIKPVGVVNLLIPLNPQKKQRRRYTILSHKVPNRSIHIKRAGHSTHLETPYRGSVMFLCQVFIKSSQDYASAINAVGHTCGARIQSMPQKIARLQQVLEETRQHPQTSVALYQDEFSFYRNPTLAKDWARTGTKTPLAYQSYKVNETCYGIGALNPHTGDVVYQQVPTVKLKHSMRFTPGCVNATQKQNGYI